MRATACSVWLNGSTTTSSSTAGGVPLEYAVLAGAARLPQVSGVDARLTSA
jgi:hypothetical protein